MIRKISLYIFLFLLIAAAVYSRYPGSSLPANAKVDSLVVFKSRRQMLAYQNDKILKTYKISLGFCPIGKKQLSGDGKTPEGDYTINAKNPNSVCHKNLGISYPNKNDIAQAKLLGKNAGGDVKIHGLKNGHGFIGNFQHWRDWTDGCIGLTDAEVDDLYTHVAVGTPIEIRP